MMRREAFLQFFDSLAYCLLITGDRKYLDEGLRRTEQLVGYQKRSRDPTMDGMVFNKPLYDHVGPTLYTVPFILGVVDAPDFPALARGEAFPVTGAEAARDHDAAPDAPAQIPPYTSPIAVPGRAAEPLKR